MKRLLMCLLLVFIPMICFGQTYQYRGSGIITASDCSGYTSLGQLCQDTDDGKLYKGTGSGVAEVASAAAYTDITALWASGSCSGVLNDDGTCKAIGTDMPGIYDTPTDGQLTKWKDDGGVWKLESAGAPVVIDAGTSTGDALIKTSTGVGKAVWLIDAHAASTTITLYAGTCPMITNASQAAADINNTLPAVGAGKCFVALATTAQASNYWRLTAAAANTVCLNRTCGKDYIEFSTPAVGDTFACMSDGTSWYCYDRDSDATAGDL